MRKIQITTKHFIALLSLALFISQMIIIPVAYAQDFKPELPERKQTMLGLYVTSAEAYEM